MKLTTQVAYLAMNGGNVQSLRNTKGEYVDFESFSLN